MYKTTCVALTLLCVTFNMNAQINLPSLSPKVEISQQIGLTNVTLSYSRPSLRGRQLMGEKGILIDGQKWRTGANASTKIELSNEVFINGQKLERGDYVILSTPKAASWSFHFYENKNLPYTQYLSKVPKLEINLPLKKQNERIESLSIFFENLSLSSASLVMLWGNSRVEIPIEVDEHTRILSNIENELKGPSSFDYFQAALYLHETQSNLPKALTYIQRATESESAQFFQVYREALILRDLNKSSEAIVAAKRSRQLAKEAKNEDFVRLNSILIEELSK